MNNYMQYQPQTVLQTPEQKQMGLLLHLSQLLGPIIPIILWQVQKDKMPAIDAHGKMVVNWTISLIIYSVVSVILMFVLIGFLTILVLSVLSIVFPIVGAVKANNGELWEYPLTIKFLK